MHNEAENEKLNLEVIMANAALKSPILSILRRGLLIPSRERFSSNLAVVSWIAMTVSLALAGLVGCGSPAIKPEAKNVEVTRGKVDSDCRSLGPVEGRTISAKATFEDALENLKLDAARKGATDVQIEATSAIGTAVRGEAFFCP